MTDAHIVDLDYPLDSADADVSASELRRLSAKNVAQIQGKYEEISELYDNVRVQYHELEKLRARARSLLTRAEWHHETLEALAEVID